MRPFKRSKQRTYVLLPHDLLSDNSPSTSSSAPIQIVIPTDLIFAAWRQLFPAERMVILGGRRLGHRVVVSSVIDVTEPNPSPVHVRADRIRLANGLVDLDRAGAHFAVWMHSHPGQGAGSTHPSGIDRQQERQFRQHYADSLINIIVVRDGHLRVWGQAIDERIVTVRWRGKGVHQLEGEDDVFKLDMA